MQRSLHFRFLNVLTFEVGERACSAGWRRWTVGSQIAGVTLGLAAVGVVPSQIPAADTPGSRAPLWTFEAANDKVPCYGQNNNGKAAQFGAVHQGQLYVSSYNGHVYQLDLETGRLQADWAVCDYRAYSSPLIVDDRIFVFADRGFYRLDRDPSPRAVKLFEVPPPGTDRPEALSHDPRSGLFFLSASEKIYAVNETGRLHWTLPHFNYGWGQALSVAGHVYAYDTRYPSYDLSERRLYKYRPGTEKPEKVWATERGFFANVPSAYLSRGVDGDGDELIFVVGWRGEPDSGSGRITAVHDSGPFMGTAKWDVELDHSVKHASLWEGRDLLIIPAMNGKIVWRQASTGKLVRELALEVGVAPGQLSPWSQITISDRFGLVWTHDGRTVDQPNHLLVIDLDAGTELWRSEPTRGGAGCMLPILSDGIAVVGTYWQGTWHAYRLGRGEPFPFGGFANPSATGNAPGALISLEGGPIPLKR
jgi:outer membrane protein assembly factor BamB